MFGLFSHGSDSDETDNTLPYSYAEAHADKMCYLIMEGDDGGQIFLTVPVNITNTNEENLSALLKEIDERTWNNPRTRSMYYIHGNDGKEIAGGMDGGLLRTGLWVHPTLNGLREYIAEKLGMNSLTK